jgi:hypothetical protein
MAHSRRASWSPSRRLSGAKRTLTPRSFDEDPAMGFKKREMEDRRRKAAEQKAAARRVTEKQILEDSEHLVDAWNERQANAQQCFPFGKPPAKRSTFITEIPTDEEWQKETGVVI